MCTLYVNRNYYNFRAEQRVSSNLIGQAVPYTCMTLNLSSGLATKLATFAISASKHGGQLVNEFLICLRGEAAVTQAKDITLSLAY